MTTTIEALHQRVDASFEALSRWHARFPKELDDLKDLLKTSTAKQNKFAGEMRLSIGIMGQVKAGKSSFLNALLFDGQPVLPEAATPKTANLTRISWGEKPTLTVTFYSPDEWKQIEKAAASGSEHTEARVGRELVQMAKAQGLDVSALLRSGQKVVEADDIEGLIGIMNDYVGESGKYTALVQMTELLLPDDALKGYEIVDTPGMNDPVPSRTDKTREYMATCDVVLFLSRCGQFLDQSDMELLAVQLPAKGVKRMALVAGQMDGAIVDDGYDRRSLDETERNIRERLTRRAHTEMGKLVAMRETQGDMVMAELFRGLQTPIFASTFAHLFAHWPEERWRVRESLQIAFANLAEVAQMWGSASLTREDWERIGNFGAIRAVYDRARADKDLLLDAQRTSVYADIERQWHVCLDALAAAVDTRDGVLASVQLGSVREQQKTCEANLERIATKLAEVFDTVHGEAQREGKNLCQALKKDVARYETINKRTGSESETHSRTVSTSVWYNPFSWGDTETVYYTVTKSYEYVASADAIERLVDYSNKAVERLETRFASIVSMDALRLELRRVLLKELDTSRVGFDAGIFRTTLEKTLGRLKLPLLSLEVGNVSRRISARFGTEVRGEEQIEALQAAVTESLHDICAQLADEVASKVTVLCRTLERVKQKLAGTMTEDLQRELEQLQDAFAEKEAERRLYARILAVIGESRGIAQRAQAA